MQKLDLFSAGSPKLKESVDSRLFRFDSLTSQNPQQSCKRHTRDDVDARLIDGLFVHLMHNRDGTLKTVESLKIKHIGRSERWYWEKAVEDLDRYYR